MPDNRIAVEPCPFCEGLSMFALELERRPPIKEGLKQIVCSSCWASGPTAQTEEEAAEKWNWRPNIGYENRNYK